MARPASDIRPRVLRAARDRFLVEGVDGASLRNIAKDAKTSVGMVYYYFATKEELFLAVVEDVYSVLLADLVTALDPSLPVEERLRRLYVRVGSATEDEVIVIRLVLREALVSSARREEIVARFQRGHVPLMLRLVMEGVGGGSFDARIHPVVIFGAMMALGGPGQLLMRFLAPRAPITGAPGGAELSETLVSLLLHGIGAKVPGLEKSDGSKP